MGEPHDIDPGANKSKLPDLDPDDPAETGTPEEQLEDAEDIRTAHEEEEPEKTEHSGRHTSWWRKLGPGLITGAADDDPSGIGTYSVTGAQFGYRLLWLVPFCIPLMIAVQEMCGRIGVVTGKGLAAVIKEHYPKWLLFGSVFLLVAANVANIYADL